MFEFIDKRTGFLVAEMPGENTPADILKMMAVRATLANEFRVHVSVLQVIYPKGTSLG